MKKTLIAAILLSLLAIPGCAKGQQADTPASQQPAIEIPASEQPQASKNAQNTPDASSAVCRPTFNAQIPADKWVEANNAFGIKLLHATSSDKSVVFSPYSIERAMGMALEGACKNTEHDLRKALDLPDADNLAQAGLEVEKHALIKPEDNNNNVALIDINNRLWVEKNYTLLPDYLQRVKSAYNATPESVDFVSKPEETRSQINDFISKATHEKIQNLLPQGSVTSLTRSILTNAIYFKAPWKNSFKKELTQKRDFITENGPIEVDMMQQNTKHRVFQTDDYVAFDLEFKDCTFSFMIILPTLKESESPIQALHRVESSLTAQSFAQIRDGMDKMTVNLSLPKFKMEANMALRPLLEQFGAKSAFGPDADFSGMTGSRDLSISDIYHKAFIEVDEEGAEAAAATAVVMTKRSMPLIPPITINVDHPFLFSIVEQESGSVFFLGRMTKI